MSGLARLRHDVAKYIVRVAQNVGAEVPASLAPLLLRDVYGAAEAFERDRLCLSDKARAQCDEAFAALRQLEPSARAGELASLRRVLMHARAIARAIDEDIE